MRTSLIGGAVLVLLAVGAMADDEKPAKEAKEQEPSFWMEQKLKYAQEILNGLAKEDYELITKNAQAMRGLSRIEYLVRQQPANYRTQLKTFQYSVDAILRSAENRNLDGATLGFTQMTISCVNCHKELRSE